MSLLKNKTLGFIASLVISTTAWGQTIPPKPNICTTPPAGYLLGGESSLSPPISCVSFGADSLAIVKITNKNDANTGIFVDNPIFYFIIKLQLRMVLRAWPTLPQKNYLQAITGF